MPITGLVISIDEAGYGKGSARSVAGFSIGDQILAARQDGLLKTGGGHDMAAGLGLGRRADRRILKILLWTARGSFCRRAATCVQLYPCGVSCGLYICSG